MHILIDSITSLFDMKNKDIYDMAERLLKEAYQAANKNTYLELKYLIIDFDKVILSKIGDK